MNPPQGATAVAPTPAPEAPLLVREPEEHESNPVVIVLAALCMPFVAGWRLFVAAGRGLRALGRRWAGWADSLLRWLGRGFAALGRGLVAVVRWIGRGMRAVAGVVGPILLQCYVRVRTLLAPVARAIGWSLVALCRGIGRGVAWAARCVGEALRSVGAVVARMWRALYGPEALRAIGRLLVAAGRGVEWLGRGIGRAFSTAGRGVAWVARFVWRALQVACRTIGRGLAVAGRGMACAARYVGRALRAAGVGVGRLWHAVYGPEIMYLGGALLVEIAGLTQRFLRWLWRGLAAPFRRLRRVLRPFSAAVGDLKRRCAVSMRRQWRALRSTF